METQKQTLTLEDLATLSNQNYLDMIKNKQVTKILRAIGLFPDQTITNDVLIVSQRPDAICVKRMKEWSYYRRSVIKNEKSIRVISHYIEKFDKDFTDESGNTYTKGIEKLKTGIGYLFDISQTEGKEYEYLNSNKENIAKHFETAKSALERTVKGYEFKYVDQEEKSKLDTENKVVYIKDGMSLDDVINTLLENVAKILLATRRQEGLENYEDFELNATLYAIDTKLGLELPKYDFEALTLDDVEVQKLKDNLGRVRSVTKQILSNFETAIEKAIRDLDKKVAEQEQIIEEANQNNTVKKTIQKESEVQ